VYLKYRVQYLDRMQHTALYLRLVTPASYKARYRRWLPAAVDVDVEGEGKKSKLRFLWDNGI
jgi:hypothetical protein